VFSYLILNCLDFVKFVSVKKCFIFRFQPLECQNNIGCTPTFSHYFSLEKLLLQRECKGLNVLLRRLQIAILIIDAGIVVTGKDIEKSL